VGLGVKLHPDYKNKNKRNKKPSTLDMEALQGEKTVSKPNYA